MPVQRPKRTLNAVSALCLALLGCGASAEDCAKGTQLKNGVCVPTTVASDGRPQVEDLVVKYLHIAEEGQRPVYLLHPLNVTLGLELKAQPFKSDVVIGFSSADGTKHCAAGYMEFVFTGGADAGVNPDAGNRQEAKPDPKQSNRGEITISETLFVQPRCKALVGEEKATVWVAVDPFRRLQILGDKRPGGNEEPTSLEEIDAFLHASRWPLTFCRSSHKSGHPGNCKSTVSVLESPGLDTRLRRVQPSSAVVTVAPPEQLKATEKSKRDADLFANVTTVTYGTEFKPKSNKPGTSTNDPLDDSELEFYFMIRPDVALADLPDGVSAADVSWEPLTVIDKGDFKEGAPELSVLLQQFLASLQSAVRRQLDVPLLFSDPLLHRLREGNWRRFSKFELLGCVKPSFKEAEAKGLSKSNNCKTSSIVLARHEYANKPLGGHHSQYTVTPNDGSDDIELEWAIDPKDSRNMCKTEKEIRPPCVALNQHLDKIGCFGIPEYKVEQLDEDCHCCYPKDAFDPFIGFAHEPEVAFTLGSNESIGLRTRLWWNTQVHNKSLFEPDPLRARSTVGFDVGIVGWWTQGLLYVDTPIQLGIKPGQQSYWWPELSVLGFSLWDQKYIIEEDDPLFEVEALAAKEWTQNYCQTFCVKIICFDLCAQVGARVSLEPGVRVNEKAKSIGGELMPKAAAIAGGSAGLNLFLGVVGLKLVFDDFIGFGTPIGLDSQFVVKKIKDAIQLQITGKASYVLKLEVLKGTVAGFWSPKWGGGDQDLDLYEWDGLTYIWTLWTKKQTWTVDF